MVKDMNTKFTKTPEKQVKDKAKLPKVTNSSRKEAAPKLPKGAAERHATGGKLPGKSPGAKMGAVAKAANRGTR